MFNEQLLAGRRILVTGGGTGLGKSMAARFLELGAEVHICGRRKSVCDETATELMDLYGGRVTSHGVDIRNALAVDEMIETIFTDGPLTDLINNAAGNFISRTEDLSPRGFDAVANIVMHGTFYVTHAVGRRWIAAQAARQCGVDHRHLGAQRQPLCGAVGDEQIRDPRHDHVAGDRMGPLRHPAQHHRARRNSDRRHEQAHQTRRRSRRAHQGDEPDGPRRQDGGTAEPRGVPDFRRLRLDQRRDHRHGRRPGAGDGRQFLSVARLDRCRLDTRRATRSRRRTKRTAPRGDRCVVPANADDAVSAASSPYCLCCANDAKIARKQKKSHGGNMSVSEGPANLADMVRARAKTRGNAIAYEFEGRQTSFAEFDRLDQPRRQRAEGARRQAARAHRLSRQEQRHLFRTAARRHEGQCGDGAGQLAARRRPRSPSSSRTARRRCCSSGPNSSRMVTAIRSQLPERAHRHHDRRRRAGMAGLHGLARRAERATTRGRRSAGRTSRSSSTPPAPRASPRARCCRTPISSIWCETGNERKAGLEQMDRRTTSRWWRCRSSISAAPAGA